MRREKTRNIKLFTVFAVCVFIIATLYIGKYVKANMDYFITYSEKSDIDYKVYLKKNDYFKNRYLGKNTKYIASIIDYINTDFSYALLLPDDTNYKYLYKIMAEVKVKDKDDDITYYEYAEELFNSGVQESKSIVINKKIDVDYNKYNNLMSDFVNDFDLDRSVSNLKITLKVMILDNGNKYANEIEKNRTISLNIPLTTKTISIDMSSDLNNSDDNKILVRQDGNKKEYLVIGISWAIIALIIGVALIIYYINNRTPHALYKKKLKSIINNYSSYIQEIDNSHKIGASVVYKLKSFDDLLEVRDTIQKPILMIHNNKNTGTFFIIPANEYTIYTYAIRVVDIVANKKGLVTPEYDVHNLGVETMEEKKFTKQYIDSQIDDATKTILMQKLDADNIIKGNKENDENIYEQLEKTTSYKISDFKEALKEKEKKSSKTKKTSVTPKKGEKKISVKKVDNKTKKSTAKKETVETRRKPGRPKKNS